MGQKLYRVDDLAMVRVVAGGRQGRQGKIKH